MAFTTVAWPLGTVLSRSRINSSNTVGSFYAFSKLTKYKIPWKSTCDEVTFIICWKVALVQWLEVSRKRCTKSLAVATVDTPRQLHVCVPQEVSRKSEESDALKEQCARKSSRVVNYGFKIKNQPTELFTHLSISSVYDAFHEVSPFIIEVTHFYVNAYL
jgi:hypothetical protein